jgi:aspartate racemase
MEKSKKQVYFGIIGNMGPEADIAFQDCIRKASVKLFNAISDQDHINMVVIKNTSIPDRSKAINEGGTSPVPEILESCKKLKKLGVSYAVMPCNTAHYFKDRIQKKTDIHILDMPQATVQAIKETNPESVVGLLATTGTCNMQLYDTYFTENNVSFVKPNEADQENYVHSAIYGNKTGQKDLNGADIREPNGLKSAIYQKNADLLIKMIGIFITQGCNSVLLGCTELPLVEDILQTTFPQIHFFNPMVCTAEKAVKIFYEANEKINSKQVKLQSALKEHSELTSITDTSDYVSARTVTNNNKNAKIKLQIHRIMSPIKSLNCSNYHNTLQNNI